MSCGYVQATCCLMGIFPVENQILTSCKVRIIVYVNGRGNFWYPQSSKIGCVTGCPTAYQDLLSCPFHVLSILTRGELSYLAPLGSENISAPYFKQCFFGGGVLPPIQSNTTPPSPKTEITNILFYILNFASIIFKM